MDKGQKWYSVQIDESGNVVKSSPVTPRSIALDAAGNLLILLHYAQEGQAQTFTVPPFPPTINGWAGVDGKPMPSGPAVGA